MRFAQINDLLLSWQIIQFVKAGDFSYIPFILGRSQMCLYRYLSYTL